MREREPRSNIVGAHRECILKGGTLIDDGPGKRFRKISFPTAPSAQLIPRNEWMWVRVESLTDRSGILDNDPSWATYVKAGDKVTFRALGDGSFEFVNLSTPH